MSPKGSDGIITIVYLSSGENPKGLWKVKVTDSPLDDNGQRMVSGYGTLHADTSKQEHDVEDLEQQVIDDQTKQQQNLVEQMRNKASVVCRWRN